MFFNPPPQTLFQTEAKPAATSPFFMFLADQQKATKEQNSDIKLLNIAANAIKEWDEAATLRDEYLAKSLEEAEKYEFLALSKVQPSTLPQSQIQPSQVTLSYDANGNPLIPKRPLSAFFIFKSDCYDQVRRENPTLKITDVTKIVAQRWGNLSAEAKSFYEAKNQEAKAIYEQQIALYESTYGKIERRGIFG